MLAIPFLSAGLSAHRDSETHVLVLATMHKLHQSSATYSYEDVYRTIATFRPDLVGVEIRQEDLGRPPAYLRSNYPEEMVALALDYGSKAFGFDWLGNELAGRAIPPDWWSTQSEIKKLEREIDTDPLMAKGGRAEISARMDKVRAQESAILDLATAATLNDGRYDALSSIYYQETAQLTRGTRYEALSRRYLDRDRHISANILREIRRHPGAKIALACGADHHGPVISALRDAVPRVEVEPVSSIRPTIELDRAVSSVRR